MDNLPIELLLEIYNFLNLRDKCKFSSINTTYRNLLNPILFAKPMNNLIDKKFIDQARNYFDDRIMVKSVNSTIINNQSLYSKPNNIDFENFLKSKNLKIRLHLRDTYFLLFKLRNGNNKYLLKVVPYLDNNNYYDPTSHENVEMEVSKL